MYPRYVAAVCIASMVCVVYEAFLSPQTTDVAVSHRRQRTTDDVRGASHSATVNDWADVSHDTLCDVTTGISRNDPDDDNDLVSPIIYCCTY